MTPGQDQAVSTGTAFEAKVAKVIQQVGLSYIRQVKMGVSILGRKRVADFLVYDRAGKSLGIECKYQQTRGSAEDKLVHTITDFDARPVSHILVFGGEGFSKNIKGYLLSTGKAVELKQLRNYLVFYFGLEQYFEEFGQKPR
jgi:hypothetical protein